MVVVKNISAKQILDSRKGKTIFVSIVTNKGRKFSASSPTGKSTGKYEKKPYKKNLEEDIKKIKQLSDYFSKEVIEKFEDLRRVEDIVDGHIGANTLFALESAILKALADEQKKQIWQLFNPGLNEEGKFPRLVGNCIGGGKHTKTSDSTGKPDFQEFLLIPETNSVVNSWNINKDAKVDAQIILKNIDSNFKGKKNDEDAWVTSLDDKRVLEVLKDVKDNIWDGRKIYLDEGLDVASSVFYKRKKYHYLNPRLMRTEQEQFDYISNLIENFHLLYIEDPFHEEDFESFSRLLKKFPDRLIVGDDLTVTNTERLKKAIKMKSINGIIIKPNQVGSLLEVRDVVKLAKKNNIKTIFSHRSGETDETILADLAFGFQADFFKCGITGKVREAKHRRLIEIDENLKRD
jgi:enolase